MFKTNTLEGLLQYCDGGEHMIVYREVFDMVSQYCLQYFGKTLGQNFGDFMTNPFIFQDTIGGNICIAQSLDDCDDIADGEGYTLLGAGKFFDMMFYTIGGEYLVVYLIDNNAGGSMYFIPRNIYRHLPDFREKMLHVNGKELYMSSQADLVHKSFSIDENGNKELLNAGN